MNIINKNYIIIINKKMYFLKKIKILLKQKNEIRLNLKIEF